MNEQLAHSEPRFGLLYNLRKPPFVERTSETLYAETLDQIVWAEELGLDSVWISEHHFVEDGSTPSPLMFLAAIAARTTRLHLGTGLIVPALHNPIRLAEDAAALAIISNGRFDLGMGIGYREEEFEAFSQPIANRVSLLEETVEVLRRAMAGRSLAFEAKRFRLPDVRVTPVPRHSPRILIGGERKPAIQRAARIGDGFLSTNDTSSHSVYLQALEDLGKDPGQGYISAIQRMVIAEDPESTWPRIGDYALWSMNQLASDGAFPGVTGFAHRDELLTAGLVTLMDVPAAVDQLTQLLADCPPIRDVHIPASLPGEDAESISSRLECYARHVVPRVRANLSKLRSQKREGC